MYEIHQGVTNQKENNAFYAILGCCVFQHFKLLVEEIHVKGEAKINKAMKEAFKILSEVCTHSYKYFDPEVT